MTKHETLDRLFADFGGIVRTADAVSAGVSKPIFYKYIKDRGMERAAHEIYIVPDAWAYLMATAEKHSSVKLFADADANADFDEVEQSPVMASVRKLYARGAPA